MVYKEAPITEIQKCPIYFKVILLKLFYYQFFLKLGLINIHDMNI